VRYCAWEGREFEDDAFDFDGVQYIHKGVKPRHNSLGESDDDNGGFGGTYLPGSPQGPAPDQEEP
jgi:hypothetical protein